MSAQAKSRLLALFVFIPALVALSMATIWIIAHQYTNDVAYLNWARISAILSAPEVRLEDLGLIYPHIPLYQLIPFYYLPGLNSFDAPFFATVFVGSALLAVWFRHLQQRGYSLTISLVLLVTIVLHPQFLWAITSGTEKALSLFLFYLLCYSCVRMVHVGDVRAFIMLGCVMAIFFFVDQRTFYLFLALLPMIVLIAPQRMLKDSILSVYASISLPLLIALCSWMYLNWLFTGDPLQFIYEEDSSFLGAKHRANEFQWLQITGGQFFQPFVLASVYSLLSYPVLIWFLYKSYRHKILFRGATVILLHPLIAAALATQHFFLNHPANIIFLYSAGLMALFILMPRLRKTDQKIVIVLLLLSNLSGWATFSWWSTEERRGWQTAIVGDMVEPRDVADKNLGKWLRDNPEQTMIDLRVGYRAVVERHNMDELVLPFMKEFKVAVKKRDAQIKQIVVMNPQHEKARRDRVSQHFNTLYLNGISGYKRVYDQDYWRVYRRIDVIKKES